MQHFYKSITLLILNTVGIVRSTSYFNSLNSKEPLWSWECENEKCVPFTASQSLDKLQSLETCNMLCSAAILWPLPTGQVKITRTAIPISSDLFQLEIILASTNIVQQYLHDTFILFKEDLRNMESTSISRKLENMHNVLVRFTVNDNGNPNMRLDTDESYHLSLERVHSLPMTVVADIVASSFCGARHALETLSQLVWFDRYTDTLFILEEATISDKPKFGYRGLMVDTARNFIPFSELLRTVDAMAASKLNTLHWHASDSQAFSLQLNSIPDLAQSRFRSDSDFYTSDQVKALVHRARLRGIRVIIEIDTPAHVSVSWNLENNIDLVQCFDDYLCENPPCGQLNPLNPHVFEILQKIYSEIIHLTGVDDLFHLGGDDVSESCWTTQLKYSEPNVMWLDFTRSALQHLELVNGKLPNLTLIWSSHLNQLIKTDLKDISSHLGVQTRNATWSKRDSIKGLRTVVSHEDTWDLNSGHSGWYETKSKLMFNSWQRIYEHRPWIRNDREKIEGGEATLWSWTMSEGGTDVLVWPRAAALAERLWSDIAEGVTRSVYARLDIHRTRLASRGVQCAPIWSQWCTQNPYTCS